MRHLRWTDHKRWVRDDPIELLAADGPEPGRLARVTSGRIDPVDRELARVIARERSVMSVAVTWPAKFAAWIAWTPQPVPTSRTSRPDRAAWPWSSDSDVSDAENVVLGDRLVAHRAVEVGEEPAVAGPEVHRPQVDGRTDTGAVGLQESGAHRLIDVHRRQRRRHL